MNKLITKLIALLCLGLSLQLFAADPETTTESTDETAVPAPDTSMLREKGQLDGYVELDTGSGKSDAMLFNDRTGKRYGGVLILPDKGNGYFDNDVVKTLTQNLPDYGWSVMTIALDYPDEVNIMLSEEQKIELDIVPPAAEETTDVQKEMPAEAEPESVDKVSRNVACIQTAMSYFKQQDLPNYILLAHGQSTRDAINMLKLDAQIANVFIAIGSDIDLAELMQLPDEVLMLDILPSGWDIQKVHARKAEMTQANKRYRQRLIQAQDKNFTGYQQPLLSTVHGWLYKSFVEEKQ